MSELPASHNNKDKIIDARAWALAGVAALALLVSSHNEVDASSNIRAEHSADSSGHTRLSADSQNHQSGVRYQYFPPPEGYRNYRYKLPISVPGGSDNTVLIHQRCAWKNEHRTNYGSKAPRGSLVSMVIMPERYSNSTRQRVDKKHNACKDNSLIKSDKIPTYRLADFKSKRK